MKTLAAIIAPLLLVACASKVASVDPATKQPPVKTAEAVSPLLIQVQDDAAKADAKRRVTESKVGDAARTAGALHKELEAAVAEADRLRKQKAASASELDQLWGMLTAASQRNMFLETQLAESQAGFKDEQMLREEAQKNLKTAQLAGIAKDEEAATLRSQLTFEGNRVNDFKQQADNAVQAAAVARSAESKVRGELGLWRWACLVLSLLLGISLAFHYFRSIV